MCSSVSSVLYMSVFLAYMSVLTFTDNQLDYYRRSLQPRAVAAVCDDCCFCAADLLIFEIRTSRCTGWNINLSWPFLLTCLHGLAAPCLADELSLAVVNVWSSTLIVHHMQFSTVEQVFPVAAADAWNCLLQQVTWASTPKHIWRPTRGAFLTMPTLPVQRLVIFEHCNCLFHCIIMSWCLLPSAVSRSRTNEASRLSVLVAMSAWSLPSVLWHCWFSDRRTGGRNHTVLPAIHMFIHESN